MPNWPLGLLLAQDPKVVLSLVNHLHCKIKALKAFLCSSSPLAGSPCLSLHLCSQSSQGRFQTSPPSRPRLFWLHTCIYLFSITSCTSVKAFRWYLRGSVLGTPPCNKTPRQHDCSEPRVLLTTSKQLSMLKTTLIILILKPSFPIIFMC